MKYVGMVCHGKKRGRVLGFPTVNISLEGLEKNESGVYSGRTIVNGERYECAVFIHPSQPLLEAHILDFEGDLYGSVLTIDLAERVRESMRFESKEELIDQISKDVEMVREISNGRA